MKSNKSIFDNALSIEELEKRFEMSQTGLLAFLRLSSCIPITPTLPDSGS